MEARMRTVIILASAVVVVVIGLAVKANFVSSPQSDAEPSISKSGLLPFEIHLNHPNMKGLVVEEIKDPV
jgi:hypothetical protein